MAQERREGFRGRPSSGGVYAPDPAEDEAFGDGPSAGPRGPLILALASAIIIILAVVIWNAYRDGVKADDPDRLPVVEADSQPARAPPDEQGDTGAGDLAAGIPASVLPDAVPEAVIEPPSGPDAQELAKIVPDIAIAGADTPDAADEAPPSSVIRARGAASEGKVPDPPSGDAPATGSASVPVPAPGPKPGTNTQRPGNTGTGGAWLVQLGSVRSADAAEMVWAKAVKAAPARFGSVQKEVERVELGPQGVFFRVRAGPFANRAAAEEFCNVLKTAGESCFSTVR